MTAQISIAAGSQHVMVYLPDNTYVKIEPNSQHQVQLDGLGLLGINQIGEAEDPPTGDDVKAFFIKIFQAVRDHIESSPPPEAAKE